MSQLALSLIEECIRTQNPYLDLGCCGLTDALVAEGTVIDLSLRKCRHLKTLIFSNQWWDWEKEEWVNSQNMGGNNFFATHPPTLPLLSQLEVLRCGGDSIKKWQIADMSFVSELQDLRFLELVFTQITEIKGLETLIKLEYLDVRVNQISKIKGLENLKNLQQLIISANKITQIKGLETLIKLEHIDVHINQISKIKGLENLKNLQKIDISENKITELKGLEALTNLQKFDISENQITELKGLEALTNLQQLSISSNKISEIKGLEALNNLQQLSISSNKISELKGLEVLTHLQKLSISFNKISEIKGLEALTNLQILYISANQITELKGLEALTNLQQLSISANQITELKGLETLNNLQQLSISANQITELKGLETLNNLQYLDISGNKITELRPLLPFIQRETKPFHIVWKEVYETKEGEISVKNNPFTIPPLEIVKQGNQAILDWFAANKDTFKEVKVLLIGDAKAGKTSLLRRLKEDIYQEGEEQTDGIIIEKFAFKDLPTFADYPTLHEATAYFWDFGGQETMSATHQFFMTKRSVYLLLLEARKDKKADEQLRELMEQVQAFGGNSQVIVVVNKIDLNTGFGLDSPTLLQDYPQIKDIVYISCKEDLNIDKVKQALANAIPKAELYETEIDERWKAIKEVLQTQTDTQHYLPENNFLSICNQNKLTERRQQNNAISFLHDLGILLHFEQLDLSEFFVLEPYWVTTGVYQILTSPFAGDADGKIPVERLKYIINEEEEKKNAYCPTKKIHYSSNEVRFIADIMTQFKLAYYTSDRQTLLVPDLFENKTPLQLTNTFTETADCLRFVYEYSYLPKSILPRFMVEMQIDIQTPWRTGAILQSKQNLLSSALVVVREKQIHIYVKGEHKQKREYLSVIRFFLDKINESLNLKPTLKIPLPGFEKYYAKYEHLLKKERKGETYEDLDLDKEFSPSKLLEGIERREAIVSQEEMITAIYEQSTKTSKKLEELSINIEKLKITIFEKIGIESTTIQAAIKSSSTQQVQQMEKMLQEINGMSIETQAQLWDGFSLLAQRNQAIKTFVEKVEAERVARQIEDSANVKLKIGLPFMIKEILGVGVEYETTLADGKTFFDWFKKWQGIII